jgi:hypothetical protein
MTGPDLLHAVGVALYGPVSPARQLGEAVRINERTVMRWAGGTKAVPPHAWVDIRTLLVQHAARCELLAAEVNAAACAPTDGTSKPDEEPPAHPGET